MPACGLRSAATQNHDAGPCLATLPELHGDDHDGLEIALLGRNDECTGESTIDQIVRNRLFTNIRGLSYARRENRQFRIARNVRAVAFIDHRAERITKPLLYH